MKKGLSWAQIQDSFPGMDVETAFRKTVKQCLKKGLMQHGNTPTVFTDADVKKLKRQGRI